MENKTILILGGGVGGIIAANKLRKIIPLNHKIILIEKNSLHSFVPSFLWLMIGERSSNEITTPLKNLLHKNIDVHFENAVEIDTINKQVSTDNQKLKYDYLIIALGAELAANKISGLEKEAKFFYTLEQAENLFKELKNFKSGKVCIVISSLPYKCPGAPNEAAMLIENYFNRRGIRDKVEIHLFTPEQLPMPVAGPTLGELIKKMLQNKKINFHPLHKLISVDSELKNLHFENKEPIHFDFLIAIPPHTAPKVLRDSGLTNENGWVTVDRYTLKTKYENVFAIGDNSAVSIPGRWKPDLPLMLPKAGVFAHLQAEIVAKNISDEILQRKSSSQFDGSGYCMLEAGDGLAGFAYGDFFGEPNPKLELKKVGTVWHIGKVLFEKWWLAPIGFRKLILQYLLLIGSKLLKIPVKV